MRRRTRLATVAAALVVGWSTAAVAQTVVVTPDDTQGWKSTGTQGGGTVGITAEQPRSGSGSLEMNTSGSSGRVRYIQGGTSAFGSSMGKVSEINSLSFDWFRSSASTAAAHFSPAFRVHVGDGFKSSELIWEFVYSNPKTAAPTDGWQSVNLLASDQLFYKYAGGVVTSGGAQVNQSFGDWLASYGKNAKVVGISVGFGSGASGTFEGYVDNVRLGFAGKDATTWNFETHAVSTVPEPASMLLLASGLLALGGLAVVRKRGHARG